MSMVTYPHAMLRLWRKYFSTLIQGDDDINTAYRGIVPNAIDDDGVEIPPTSHEAVKVATMRLKPNKAARLDGLPAELFNAGCSELVGRMNQFIYKIRLEESMRNDWNFSVLWRPYDMRQLQSL